MTPEIAVAVTFAVALAVRHASQAWLTRGKVAGTRSGWASTFLLFIGYVSGMCLALRALGAGTAPLRACISGCGLWTLGVSVRMWALSHLREQYSSLIEMREDHRLVTSGPYAVVRHPLHLAFALEVSSFAVVAWNWYASIPAAMVWVVVLVRNRTEDAALRAHFSSTVEKEREYRGYRSAVPAMDPLRGVARLLVRSWRGRREANS